MVGRLPATSRAACSEPLASRYFVQFIVFHANYLMRCYAFVAVICDATILRLIMMHLTDILFRCDCIEVIFYDVNVI